MSRKRKYDHYTIKYDEMDLKNGWGKMTLDVFNTIIHLKADGRYAITGIINLLHDDTLDHKDIIGEQKYRYVIKSSQNKLAKLIGMTISHFSSGIKQLVDAKLVIKKDGLFYINPLVFNANQIIDKRTAKMFGIDCKHTKNANDQVTRKKADISDIRDDLEF